jgi:hypothetical protein
MNYTKPEITSLASASSVIQGTQLPKAQTTTHDAETTDYLTPPAYEGDE